MFSVTETANVKTVDDVFLTSESAPLECLFERKHMNLTQNLCFMLVNPLEPSMSFILLSIDVSLRY